MGIGRELLTLNLGFGRVAALPPEAMPGEALTCSGCASSGGPSRTSGPPRVAQELTGGSASQSQSP